MIGTYVFIILVRVEKKFLEISLSHMWKTGMCAHASSEFVSCCKQIKRSQSGGWLWPQSSPKVTISVYVVWWKLLFHSTTILFSPFPRLYKANLSKFLPMRWHDLNFQGGDARLWGFIKIDRIIIKKKKRWLKLVCWHFCYLANKRTD